MRESNMVPVGDEIHVDANAGKFSRPVESLVSCLTDRIYADRSAVDLIDELLARPVDLRGKPRCVVHVAATTAYDLWDLSHIRDGINQVIDAALTDVLRGDGLDTISLLNKARAVLVARIAEYEAARDKLS